MVHTNSTNLRANSATSWVWRATSRLLRQYIRHRVTPRQLSGYLSDAEIPVFERIIFGARWNKNTDEHIDDPLIGLPLQTYGEVNEYLKSMTRSLPYRREGWEFTKQEIDDVECRVLRVLFYYMIRGLDWPQCVNSKLPPIDLFGVFLIMLVAPIRFYIRNKFTGHEMSSMCRVAYKSCQLTWRDLQILRVRWNLGVQPSKPMRCAENEMYTLWDANRRLYETRERLNHPVTMEQFARVEWKAIKVFMKYILGKEPAPDPESFRTIPCPASMDEVVTLTFEQIFAACSCQHRLLDDFEPLYKTPKLSLFAYKKHPWNTSMNEYLKIDYSPYAEQLQKHVEATWSAPIDKRETLLVRFDVNSSGEVSNYETSHHKGGPLYTEDPEFQKAAEETVFKSVPMPSPPAEGPSLLKVWYMFAHGD